MAITPRTRPPLLDQRLPPRRPELQQRLDVPAAAPPPPPPVGAPFPFWLVPVGTLLATCIFLTTHFLDHNQQQAGVDPLTAGDYHPSPWGPNPEGRLGNEYVDSLNKQNGDEVGYHSLPKYGDDEDGGEDGGLEFSIKSLYGEEFDDSQLIDPMSREFFNEHCVLHGDVPKEVLSCEPISELVPNLDYPNVAVEYISNSYNSDEDSTTFTYNVCSLDDNTSISHVTFPYLGNCCVMRTHYFGSTAVGGVDSMTCTFGNSLDTGFASLPEEKRISCQIYTITYMGNVPATSKDDAADKTMVAIGLGTDKYLLQHVPGPDCRAPFSLKVPESYSSEWSSSNAFGGEDGTVEVPATEGREANGEGSEGEAYDFENMFGTDETSTTTTETTTTTTEEGEAAAQTEGETTSETSTTTTTTEEGEPESEEFDFNEMFGTESTLITTETTTTEETKPQTSQGTTSQTTTSTTQSTGRESAVPGFQGPGGGGGGYGGGSGGGGGVQNFSPGGAFPWEAPPPSGGGGGGGGYAIPTTVGGGGGGGGGFLPGPGVGGGGGVAAGGRNYGNQWPAASGGAGAYAGATHGYTSAVNVQSQEYAFTKTAMYSEATDDCVPRADIGYRSKSGQDEALYEIYYSNPFKCGGVVVEINVGNGHKFSSSYYFEYAMGWKSILIEPNPKIFEKLELNRPSATTWNKAFCSNEDKELTFVEGAGKEPGKFYSSEDMNNVVASVPITKGQAPNGGKTVKCIDDLSSKIIKETNHKHVDIMYVANRGHGTASAGENAEEKSDTHQGMGDVYAALSSINFETLSLSILVLEVDPSTSFYYSSTKTLLESKGYVKAEWDIRRWCPPVFGSCAQNEVWIEKGYNPLPLFGDPEAAGATAAVETTLDGKRRRLQEAFESKPRLSVEQLESHGVVVAAEEESTIKSNLRRR